MIDITKDAAKPAASTAKKVKCVIQRDYWDEAGKRHPKGKVIEVTTEQALDGVESGALKRYKAPAKKKAEGDE